VPGISERVRSQCRLTAEHARLVTGSPRATLLLYDEVEGNLVTAATTGADLPLQDVAIDLIRRNYPGLDPLALAHSPQVNPLVAAAFLGKRTQVSSIAEAFENIFPASVTALVHGLVGVTTVVSCPVVAEGRGLGLIRFLVPGPPGDPQLALMEAAANQIGLILLNAELADQMARQLAATRAIGGVVRMARATGPQATLEALVEKVRELTDADLAVVYLVDDAEAAFHVAAATVSDAGREAGLGPRILARGVGRGLIGWVIASGEAAFVPDVRQDPRTRTGRGPRVSEAVIATPMRTPDRTIGCLRVSVVGGRRFAEPDLWLTQAMADQAALIVPNPPKRARSAHRAALKETRPTC